ncbi:MAG: hypothetical protein ACI4XJ_01620 [Eubacteriales bacterium]
MKRRRNKINTLIKLLGGGVMIFASCLWGRSRAAEEKRKVALLSEFISFVSFTGEYIVRFKAPLSEIYAEYTPELPEMKRFITSARESGIRTAWNTSPLPLPVKAVRTAEKFVNELGSGYAEEEREKCACTADILGKLLAGLKSDMADRVKMWYSLPPLLVSSVLLIFL